MAKCKYWKEQTECQLNGDNCRAFYRTDDYCNIIPRKPASVEPLSRLADRKGRHYEPSICDDGCEPMFFENENTIRKYLEKLPDTK